MSGRALFLNAELIRSVGMARIVEGLPPTSDLDSVVTGLSSAVRREAPKIHGQYQDAAKKLQRLLKNGGAPAEFANAQKKIADALVKLRPEQEEAIIKATGWEKSVRRFASNDARISSIAHVMDVASASTGIYLQRLSDFVEIRSVTGDPKSPRENVFESAEWVAATLRHVGFRNVRILRASEALPAVFGEITVDKGKPTILFYSHHDVQPPGDEKDWNQKDPFKTVVRGNRMYARGAADDKGGFMAALAAIDAYRQAGLDLPVNVAFFVEGEEEIGSPHLGKLLAKLSSSVKADAVILIDADNIQSGLPTITTSTRGLTRVLVEVQTIDHGLHSGLYGGVVLDANTALSILLARLRGPNGEFFVPGITDNLPPLSSEVEQAFAAIPFSEERFRRSAGIFSGTPILGDPKLPVHARLARGYASTVLAMEGTQTVEGAGGSIVHKAKALLDLRIPPGGDVNKVASRVAQILQKDPPAGAKVKVTYPKYPTQPWEADLTHPVVGLLAEGMRIGYGAEPCFAGCGGGIGFLPDFQKRFPGVPLFPIGVEDPDTRAHSANESLNIKDFGSITRALIAFLALMGDEKK